MAAKAYSSFLPNKMTAQYATEAARNAKSSGGGLFANIDRNDLFMGTQLAGALGDMGTRDIKGNLAAVQAATSPFASSDLTGMFEQGPAGTNLAASLGEGYALAEKANERDRIQELLKAFGSRAAEGRQSGINALESQVEKNKKLLKES